MNNENQNIEYKRIWKDEYLKWICGFAIQISVYSNWMMIYNNGELPENWTIATLMDKHTSEPANPDIAKVFFRAGYIEVWGRGISNIIKYCKDSGLPAPYYKDMGTGFAIVFEKEKDCSNFGRIEETTQETTQEILELITDNPKITRKEIAEHLGYITEDGVKYNLDKLKKKSVLKRIGPNKGGYWKIIGSLNS